MTKSVKPATVNKVQCRLAWATAFVLFGLLVALMFNNYKLRQDLGGGTAPTGAEQIFSLKVTHQNASHFRWRAAQPGPSAQVDPKTRRDAMNGDDDSVGLLEQAAAANATRMNFVTSCATQVRAYDALSAQLSNSLGDQLAQKLRAASQLPERLTVDWCETGGPGDPQVMPYGQ